MRRNVELEAGEDVSYGNPAQFVVPPGASVTDVISEFVISTVTWDLIDDDADNDPVSRDISRPMVFGSLFGHIPQLSDAKRDADGATGVDLVDFLHGWRCSGLGLMGESAQEEMDMSLAPVVDQVGFPYGFEALDSVCP